MSGRSTTVAVIGCGKIARSAHLPAWQAAAEAGRCELVGVCDVDAARAEALGAAYRVPWFASAEEMLERTTPEVVDVTAAVVDHLALVLLSFEAGCHVLCEKPIAMDAGQARRMLEAAEREDRLFSTCFQYRHWEESAYLKARIAAGDLGHIHHIRTWAGGGYDFPLHRRRLPGRGVLSHWTIHNLDLSLWLLGYPQALTATAFGHQRLRRYPPSLGPARGGLGAEEVASDMEDFAAAFIRLEDETVITLEADWLQPPSERREGWAILGSRGAASIWPIGVWLDRGEAWVDDGPPPGRLAPCDYGMKGLMAGFLAAVRNGGPAPVLPAEVMRIQSLCDALYESADQGREVALSSEG